MSSREKVLAEVEALRHRDGEPLLEAQLSVNEWVGRLQAAAKGAHLAARAGAVVRELESWVEAASICVARAEVLQEILERGARDAESLREELREGCRSGDHSWPGDLDGALCEGCGVPYAGWSK